MLLLALGLLTVLLALAPFSYAVHVRVYANHFDLRASELDPGTLDVGGRSHPLGIGIGHVPLSWELFAAWQPELIGAAEVRAEEPGGFREWQRAQGGYFDGPGGRQAILQLLTGGQ